jgi:hypothetical protein
MNSGILVTATTSSTSTAKSAPVTMSPLQTGRQAATGQVSCTQLPSARRRASSARSRA